MRMGEKAGRRPVPAIIARAATGLRADLSLAVLDAALVVAAYVIVMLLRFDGVVPGEWWQRTAAFLPLAVVAHLGVNAACGLYGQMWQHASVIEARRVLLAAVLSFGVLVTVTRTVATSMPLSVLAVGALLALGFAGGVRFQSRLFALRRSDRSDRTGVRVAVLGAGETGSAVVRDMLRPASGFHPAVILDDDPALQGRSLAGVPIAGPFDALGTMAARHGVQQALLAAPSATTETVRRALALAESAGLPLKVLPPMREVLGTAPTVRDVRDVRIEDLLGREPVETDLAAVARLLAGRRVLITGAGGSIGSEIARQVADFGPSELLLLDHDETHLHDAIGSLGPGADAEQLLVDVRDRAALVRMFRRWRPQLVFHAAAHKHVPLLETHADEAVRTNVLGTANLLAAAQAVHTAQVVFISTDKAVRPASVMGASKAVSEQLVLAREAHGAVHCAVRFGNVLGSRGSVIPTFRRQIEQGGPVTVTDPRMTRYFMTVHEAVQLVLQAAALAEGGEVFMLDMGEPVSILELAERMIRLSGREVGTDVAIRITGTRPGEKLVEELHTEVEGPQPTAHPAIVRLHPPRLAVDEMQQLLLDLGRAADAGDAGRARALLLARRPDGTVIDLRDTPDATTPDPETYLAWSPSST